MQALLGSAKNSEEFTSFGQYLKDISCLFTSNEEFEKLLINPCVSNEEKLDIIREIFPKCLENKTFANFLKVLLEKSRVNFIADIYEEYVKITNSINKELDVKIVVASEINDEQIKEITDKYKEIYNATAVKHTLILDESIIGGVKVIIGNTVYDSSLKTQLEEIF